VDAAVGTGEAVKFVPVVFTSIAQIRKHKFYGNHAFDFPAFTAIDQFVLRTDTSMAHKTEALRIMWERGMGLTDEPHTAKHVREYIAELKEHY
jgi:hypothetical protein